MLIDKSTYTVLNQYNDHLIVTMVTLRAECTTDAQQERANMARNPDNQVTASTKDQSGEPTGFSIHIASGAVDLTTTPTGLTDLVTALDTELVDWTPWKYTASIPKALGNPAVGEGNREDKVELKYHDNVTLKPYTIEVPCRKGGLATEVGSDLIPAATWTDTKAKFEAYAKSPDGNAVTLDAVRIVGRNV